MQHRVNQIYLLNLAAQFFALMLEEFLNVIKLRIKSMKQKIYADLLSYYEKSLKNNYILSLTFSHQRTNGELIYRNTNCLKNKRTCNHVVEFRNRN